jgi:DNA-directed RNA polymerase specialized sigma24 family protein
MKERVPLTEEEFERLLSWLNPDRERSGRKYEEVRLGLIKIFAWNGCSDAEDLADETINRVARKLAEIKDTYVGDPALYFYGVAKYLRWEWKKKAGRSILLTPIISPVAPASQVGQEEGCDDPEVSYRCMHACIAQLLPQERELFLRYYSGEKKPKNYRQELARQMGKSPNALRVKIKRLRTSLGECIRKCVAEMGGVK